MPQQQYASLVDWCDHGRHGVAECTIEHHDGIMLSTRVLPPPGPDSLHKGSRIL